MESEKRNLAASVVFIVICYASIIFGGVKIAGHPMPEAEDEEISYDNVRLMSDIIGPHLHDDEVGALEIHRKYITSKDEYDRLEKEYNRIPRFRKPKHQRLDREQVERVYNVMYMCATEFSLLKQKHYKTPPGFFKILASYAYLPVFLEICKKKAFIENNMRSEEYVWIKERLFEAAIFASMRQLSFGDMTDGERSSLNRSIEYMCRELGWYKDKEGYSEYYPERLDVKKIPRCNVELFLDMKDKVRFTKVNFTNVSFDNDKIMRTAQALTPCP